jgi:hypothetical protein
MASEADEPPEKPSEPSESSPQDDQEPESETSLRGKATQLGFVLVSTSTYEQEFALAVMPAFWRDGARRSTRRAASISQPSRAGWRRRCSLGAVSQRRRRR